MKESYSIREIAEAIGLEESSVRKRIMKLALPFEKGHSIGRGRSHNLYYTMSLPEDWRVALVILEERRAAAAQTVTMPAPQSSEPNASHESGAVSHNRGDEKALVTSEPASVPAKHGPGCPYPLNEPMKRKALAKADLVRLYLDHIRKRPSRGERIAHKKKFVLAYNNGSYPRILEALGPVSFQTLERYTVQLTRSNDAFTLADTRGKARKGQKAVTQEQADILRKIALSPNRPTVSEVIRIARARFEIEGIEDGLHDATYRRWLKDFQREHYPEWVFYREGQKALNEKCIFHVRRDYNLLQVGDMLVSDGHTLNFLILNPWTGRPCRMTLILWLDMKSSYPCGWEIMPTENTLAITSALRRAVINLGKVPAVGYMDNGRAFRSKFFNSIQDFRQASFVGLFERLGMKTIFAWPYHAESKPVERFFETFGELERMAPSYCGTSIDNKPAHMKRNETLHRQLHEKVTGGRVPTLIEAYQAIASWIDVYANREQSESSHLAGQRPIDVFNAGKGPGFDAYGKEQLRLLMMRQDVRRIDRDGIKMPWSKERYYDPELYGRQTQSAIVLYDLHDLDSICVYDLDMNFICEARRMDRLHPAASVLGTDEDRERLRAQIALKRGLEKQTTGPARAFLEAEVIPEVKRQIEAAGFGEGASPAAQSGKVVRLPSTTAAERLKLSYEVSDRELAEGMARLESFDETAGTLCGIDEEAYLRDVEAMEARIREMEGCAPAQDHTVSSDHKPQPAGPVQPDGVIYGERGSERPIFDNPVDRYRWCLEQIARGIDLDERDMDDMRRFEAKMDDATREYWAMAKEMMQAQNADKGGIRIA